MKVKEKHCNWPNPGPFTTPNLKKIELERAHFTNPNSVENFKCRLICANIPSLTIINAIKDTYGFDSLVGLPLFQLSINILTAPLSVCCGVVEKLNASFKVSSLFISSPPFHLHKKHKSPHPSPSL